MIGLHKKYLNFCKRKFNLSDYSLVLISFFKGLFIELIIYYFFLNEKDSRS